MAVVFSRDHSLQRYTWFPSLKSAVLVLASSNTWYSAKAARLSPHFSTLLIQSVATEESHRIRTLSYSLIFLSTENAVPIQKTG